MHRAGKNTGSKLDHDASAPGPDDCVPWWTTWVSIASVFLVFVSFVALNLALLVAHVSGRGWLALAAAAACLTTPCIAFLIVSRLNRPAYWIARAKRRGRCPVCRYDVRALASSRCPECAFCLGETRDS